MINLNKAGRLSLLCFAAVSTLHLFAQLTAPGRWLCDLTQVLLMPLLAGFVLAVSSLPQTVVLRWAMAGIFFAWLGDSLPRFLDGDAGFLSMVAGFLAAQICYIVALTGWFKDSILMRPAWLLPYALALVGLVMLCAPGAGALLVPILVYGLELAAMAVLATGAGTLGAVGGAIFFISDAMIALRSFAAIEIGFSGFWIMATYTIGQLLLILSILTKEAQSLEHL